MSLIRSVEKNWVDFHGIVHEEYFCLNFKVIDEKYNYTTSLKNHRLKGVIFSLTQELNFHFRPILLILYYCFSMSHIPQQIRRHFKSIIFSMLQKSNCHPFTVHCSHNKEESIVNYKIYEITNTQHDSIIYLASLQTWTNMVGIHLYIY